MVEEYQSDREQEEALREWWSENWRWILAGIALGALILAGIFYWREYTTRQGEDAAQLYREFDTAVTAGKDDESEKKFKELVDKYGRTPYAQQARLVVARQRVTAGKFDEAKALLDAVASSAKDKELAELARLRSARVSIQLGKPDDALAMVKADSGGAYASLAHEVRGDALFAKKDLVGARSEYSAALQGGERELDRNLLELKLQDAGGTPTQPPATKELAK
jgi:predicted negative regulator of RcsB-dependent stress response